MLVNLKKGRGVEVLKEVTPEFLDGYTFIKREEDNNFFDNFDNALSMIAVVIMCLMLAHYLIR